MHDSTRHCQKFCRQLIAVGRPRQYAMVTRRTAKIGVAHPLGRCFCKLLRAPQRQGLFCSDGGCSRRCRGDYYRRRSRVVCDQLHISGLQHPAVEHFQPRIATYQNARFVDAVKHIALKVQGLHPRLHHCLQLACITYAVFIEVSPKLELCPSGVGCIKLPILIRVKFGSGKCLQIG